jgi:hypothetical protein
MIDFKQLIILRFSEIISNHFKSFQNLSPVGSGAIAPVLQGDSVALSGDGNTALVGGAINENYVGDEGTGGAWVFTQDSSGNWSQQGSKLVGSGAPGAVWQGQSVAISADGSTALVSESDYSGMGGAWVFVK